MATLVHELAPVDFDSAWDEVFTRSLKKVNVQRGFDPVQNSPAAHHNKPRAGVKVRYRLKHYPKKMSYDGINKDGGAELASVRELAQFGEQVMNPEWFSGCAVVAGFYPSGCEEVTCGVLHVVDGEVQLTSESVHCSCEVLPPKYFFLFRVYDDDP